VKGDYIWSMVDSRQLRGGPDVLYGQILKPTVTYKTDASKRMVAGLTYSGAYNFEIGDRTNTVAPELSMRMWNNVMLSTKFEYMDKNDNQQYVATVNGNYLTGLIQQKTYGLTANLQVNITPDLSLQLYGAPFTSVAKYSRFKLATNTLSTDPNDRFYGYTQEETVYDESTNKYQLNDGIIISNPDFTFNQFRSNFVLRWEYLPGSTLYFVWEYNMSDRQNQPLYNWADNLDRMIGLPAINTFMVKINYWFSL